MFKIVLMAVKNRNDRVAKTVCLKKKKALLPEQNRMRNECVFWDVLESLNLPPRRDNWLQVLHDRHLTLP